MRIEKLNLGGFSLDRSRGPSCIGIQLVEGDRITFQIISTHHHLSPSGANITRYCVPPLRIVHGAWRVGVVNEQEVHDIRKEESERMKLELEEQAHESQTSICTFLPGNGVADFLIDGKRMGWMRMEYVPKYWGIRHSTAGLDQFSTWTIERRKDGSWVMVITRLRGDAETIIQEIIAEFAKKHGVSIIECWGVGDTERDDHLPCFKSYGPERSTSCFNEKSPSTSSYPKLFAHSNLQILLVLTSVQDGFTSTAAFRYSWPQPKRD
ncbi:hypothetical protein D9613_012180 [Agrocybe pediades]|uniref:LYC1 C-terminal domain-containing protein n=1 Tax=Agrocybe pediades TaxID=84607 RepID=A0A8H4R1U3_9AGAR|nr:hypothetical protein D9613_012180 [Agrocybe pediades]